MLNVDQLSRTAPNLLQDVREYLGGSSNDTSFDPHIAGMSPYEFVQAWLEYNGLEDAAGDIFDALDAVRSSVDGPDDDECPFLVGWVDYLRG